MRKWFALAVVLSLLFVNTPVGYTQEQQEQQEQEEDIDINIAYGFVSQIKQDSVVILEYDYDTDQEIENEYFVNSSTEYEDVAGIAELVSGDEVEITFVQEDGKRTATLIVKFLPWEEGDEEVLDEPVG
jgi:cold shock CspA family protein